MPDDNLRFTDEEAQEWQEPGNHHGRRNRRGPRNHHVPQNHGNNDPAFLALFLGLVGAFIVGIIGLAVAAIVENWPKAQSSGSPNQVTVTSAD